MSAKKNVTIGRWILRKLCQGWIRCQSSSRRCCYPVVVSMQKFKPKRTSVVFVLFFQLRCSAVTMALQNLIQLFYLINKAVFGTLDQARSRNHKVKICIGRLKRWKRNFSDVHYILARGRCSYQMTVMCWNGIVLNVFTATWLFLF